MAKRCVVNIRYDYETESAYAECKSCSWGASGEIQRVEDKADEHEREGNSNNQ